MKAIHRERTTQEALDALQLLINGEHRLHIPVQPHDADIVLGDVLDERDRLRDRVAALEAALRALVEKEPLHAKYLSDGDFFYDACAYCDGLMDEMNRVFMHASACPWLVARNLVGGTDGR